MNLLDFNSYVSETWDGGYKLELDIKANSRAENWQLYFNLPYRIEEVYGVDIDKDDDDYIVSGLDNWNSLNAGQTVKAILIVDTDGREVINPEVTDFKTTPTYSKITVNFENHVNNTLYNRTAQEKDWDIEWSTQLDRYAYVSAQAPRSGTKSLRLRYPNDKQSNVGASWILSDREEYYLSYWILFAQNFDFNGKYDWSSGGKLPGLGSRGLCNGGDPCDGNNGFSARYMWRENGRAVLYLYHMNKTGEYGDDLQLERNDGRARYFERGKWHNLIQRVRINDGDESNGEIDVWMDKEKVLSQKNFKFVTNNQGVNRLFFSTFHGGYGSDWWPSEDVYAYFDDFVISAKAADVGL